MAAERADGSGVLSARGSLWATALLAPSLIGGAAFLGAFVVIMVLGTNRSRIDFVLGHLGLVAVPVAIMSEGARVIWLWRSGRRLVLFVACAFGRVVALLALAAAWLAVHLV